MLNLLTVLAVALAGKEIIKEKMTPVIPAEYWRDQRRIERDRLLLPHDEFMKRLEAGVYKVIITVNTEDVPPDESQSGVLADIRRYQADKEKYDLMQVVKWTDEGRYRWY